MVASAVKASEYPSPRADHWAPDGFSKRTGSWGRTVGVAPKAHTAANKRLVKRIGSKTFGGQRLVSWSAMLVQIIRAVQGIPLFGDETGVADQAPEFFFRSPMVSARSAHDVFFDHDAADVVPAKAQPKLAGF
jgi:hypothetical protein